MNLFRRKSVLGCPDQTHWPRHHRISPGGSEDELERRLSEKISVRAGDDHRKHTGERRQGDGTVAVLLEDLLSVQISSNEKP